MNQRYVTLREEIVTRVLVEDYDTDEQAIRYAIWLLDSPEELGHHPEVLSYTCRALVSYDEPDANPTKENCLCEELAT